MDKLQIAMDAVRVDYNRYQVKKTNALAVALRKSLLELKKMADVARRQILDETKSKKESKQSKPVVEESKPVIEEPTETPVVEPKPKRGRKTKTS